jgi:hypothetical protein
MSPKRIKVQKRIYYLYDHQNRRYQRAAHTRNKIEDRLTLEKETITLKEIQKILQEYLDPQTKEPRFINSPLKKIFWKYADHQTRLALTFAYHQRISKKNKKIPNMEIGNWQKTPFFNHRHQSLLTQARLKNLRNIIRPLRLLRSRPNVSGRHFLTLRFENIHLALDLVENRLVFSVHYDRHRPQSPFSLLKHLLFEDQKS